MVRMTDEGLRTITKAKELAPDAPDVYYIQGCLHMQNGDKVNARVNLEKALSLGHPNAEAKIKEL
jgi:Flp pilus assembly protein TadD